MTDETEKERARRRKNEHSKRTLEYELSRDLKNKEERHEAQHFENKQRNRYEDMAILFITTLVIGYVIFFMLQYLFNFFFGTVLMVMGVSLTFIYPFFHAAIWIMAILSAYHRRSVLDDLLNRFFY